MKTIWWIEADKDLRALLQECMEMEFDNIQVVHSFEKCNPKSEDLIIYDSGVASNNVGDLSKYNILTCSGYCAVRPDIEKPFNMEAVIALIKTKLKM